MLLQSIRWKNQIEDAISGFRPSELEDKVRCVADNLEYVVEINESRAYRVTVEGDDVYYYLRPQSAIQYYYPVQYARIRLDVPDSGVIQLQFAGDKQILEALS